MATQAGLKRDWAKYITELIETNQDLKCCEYSKSVKDAVVRFSQNHTPEQLEQFVEAWGKWNTPMLAKILDISEYCLQAFFGALLMGHLD